jgi:hypothetical protein
MQLHSRDCLFALSGFGQLQIVSDTIPTDLYIADVDGTHVSDHLQVGVASFHDFDVTFASDLVSQPQILCASVGGVLTH